MPKNNKCLLITAGDPAGIGYEIIIKAYRSNFFNRFKNFKPIVICDLRLMNYYNQNQSDEIPLVEISSPDNFIPGKLHCIDIFSKSFDFVEMFPYQNDEISELLNSGKAVESTLKPGEPDLFISGYIPFLTLYASAFLSFYNEEWKDRIAGIVTLPVNKYYLSLINRDFTGHTEFFGKYFSSEDYSMILHSEKITVIPVTRHVQISKVSENLTEDDIFLSIKNGFDFVREIRSSTLYSDRSNSGKGIDSPGIAVLGLNPHASDNGLIGNEEAEFIIPAIARARSAGIDVEGPISADTAFTPDNLKRYDIFIGMFHDQVLIPFKMLSFGNGVNVTYNLPVIRTSVDHGTGYDIAGSQTADIGSLKLAYKTAAELAVKMIS